MNKLCLIFFIILPFACFAQNMSVSHNDGSAQSYFLNQDLKIAFINSGYTMNIYNNNVQTNQTGEIKNITFLNVDCTSGINELSYNSEQLSAKIYPNPFSNTTNIELTVVQSATTIIHIYNVQGILIKDLLNTKLNKGTYNFTWDGSSNSGNKLSSGIYFCQIITAYKSFTNKIFLIN